MKLQHIRKGGKNIEDIKVIYPRITALSIDLSLLISINIEAGATARGSTEGEIQTER